MNAVHRTDLGESEQSFTTAVLDLAHTLGWRVVHFRPAMVRSGRWATHGQGDITGWPDIFAIRGHRAIAAELKLSKGRLTEAQSDWLEALARTDIESHCWRPEHWDDIVRTLK